ncbi:hypothetical protein Bca4012_027788 [Brassica carinata]
MMYAPCNPLNIKVIPDDVCSLQSLEKLDWSGNDFESLPETMNQLARLKHVSLCDCRRLKALPELVQLETITLSGCMSLQSFLETVVNGHELVYLHSAYDVRPTNAGLLLVLRDLRHTDATETSLVEPGLCRYQWLELWVDGCKNIHLISDQLRHLTKISYLDLSSHEFETLPSSISELSSLGTLCINKCKKLKLESLRFACFPGTEVPSYFGDKEARESITIGLPSVWPSQKLLVFDGCIMIACEGRFHIQFSPSSYDWNWESEWYIHLELQPHFFHCRKSGLHSIDNEEAAKSHHLILLRGFKNISKEIIKFGFKSNLQFTEEFNSPPAEITSCGVRLVWEDDHTDKIETE